MKRKLIASLFFILLTISFISAIEFDMKEEFSQEETLIAKLSGNFIDPPLKENIFFYRGHVKISMDVNIARLGKDYYLYAPLYGKTENNYSIVIEDVSYKKASSIISEDLVKNFTITNKTADFTIDNGFVVTKYDFSIKLENLKDEDLDIEFEITTLSGKEGGIAGYSEDTTHDISINSGEEIINFKIDLKEGKTIKLIEFKSENLTYSIPVSIFVDDFSEQTKLFAFNIEPEELVLEIPTTGDPIQRLIYIYNTGTGTLTNLKLRISESLKPYVTISENSFGKVLPESNANLNLSITPAGEKTIAGELFVETGQSLANVMRIAITFKEGASREMIPELTTDDNCADLGNNICSKEETCSNTKEIVYANDGVCCIGTCRGKASSSVGKIIGYLLILIIIAAVAWFFLRKYNKVKKPIDLLKIAKGKK
jgi:hypothetical protein